MSGELTNNDFRIVFDNYEREKKEKENNALLKEEKKLKRKQKYLIKKKKNEEKQEQKYRDRAAERRKGIIKDVKDASVLYNNVNNTIDESKFMGGDVEHTHLVKGLDFLLLNKVRNKLIDKISSEREKLKGNRTTGIGSGGGLFSNKIPSFSNDESKNIFKYFFLYEHPHHIHFKKKIENIYDNIMNNMKFKNYNKNIHAINYKYNIGMDVDKNDVPIKYIYNVDDIKTKYTYYLKNSFIEEIDTCFKWHMENRKKKKSERLSKRPLTTNLLKKEEHIYDDDDIDIFKKCDDTASNSNNNLEENSTNLLSNVYNFTNSNVNNSKGIDTKTCQNNYDIITQKGVREELDKEKNEEYKMYDMNNNLNLFKPESILRRATSKVSNENKNSLTQNIFADTYEECYPGYGNN
ncbi:RED-like protein, putative [Plasmodium malariae]|uniref:RED-like protein, putative n=1 Tax=Plasmodium malariae TaxID=5858 RepID=A0A1C3L238_PLAMA|nr:RED-like protein, putative [Plasmodium malariae]